ncbi:MAG: sulfatase [bacterium]
MQAPTNVVLITLDCVRPDFLGCYGCQTARTPNLDRLAARGIVYEQALTQAPNTWVSHAGILTGLYPHLHGVRSPYDRLHPHVPTMASLLAELGYRTAGFPGNDLVGSRAGFHEGFDLFHEEYRLPYPADPAPGGGITANNRNEWGEVLRAAERWLTAGRDPFFIWFHYLDTHHLPEYDLPDYFRFTREPLWQYYEGKISYADHRCIGGVLDLLRRCSVYEQTLLIVLSDHGEELHAGLPPSHNGGLTEGVLRVPLILFRERMPESGTRVGSLVRTVDLAPSVVRLLSGADTDRGPGGPRRPVFSGACLPLCPGARGSGLAGAGVGAGELAYAENEPLGIFCLRSEEWKYLVTPEGEALFHLPSDRLEQSNTVLRHPQTAAYFRREMHALGARGPSATRTPAERDEEETRRLLRAFGYVD